MKIAFLSARTVGATWAAFCLITAGSAAGMEFNLYRPYTPDPSPPHEKRLTFYSPQRDDLLFEEETEIIIRCQSGTRSVGLDWTLSRNLFKQPFTSGKAEPLPSNCFVVRLPTKPLYPGFYDLRVTLDIGDGKPVPGICTFGYKVSQSKPALNRPADFHAFWEKGKAEVAAVQLDAKVGEWKTFDREAIGAYNLAHASLPADYDPQGHRVEEVEAAKVNFASAGSNRVYGWIAKPKGDGPFPAMLVLPGAGFAARPIPLEHARHGYVALDIQVHGQDVDQAEYPKDPSAGDETQTFDPPEKNYYRKVYLNWLQAVNYLLSRPDVDPARIVVVGGSQGGRGSVVVAALDHRIAATVPAIAHFGNQPYLLWSKAANSAVPPQDGMDRAEAPPLADDAKGRCLPYYDIMNFAPDVKCPVMMNAGLIDPVSPAACVFGVYAHIGSAEKQMVPLPGFGHDWSAEFDRRAWRWLDDVLSRRRSK